ncbi:MAG: Fpg/Nei family DNA glycosylase [Acidimicrobiia bacterium]|nr:Fpg/Nei family DNA glycosylase [Acidimicrobiia bacterium]
MPEIPEVQAHSERMTAALAGSTLSRFEPLNFAVLKTFDPPPDGAVGQRLVTVGRRAKYLIMEFDNGHRHVVHLMQGGRLRPDEKRSRKPKFGLARWVFTDDGAEQAWLLTEAGTERKAGVWVVDGDPLPVEPLDRLGPEAPELDRDQLAELLGRHSRRIHGLLREQTVIAGLGRMLANEICYEARLSPFANAAKLDDDEIDRLHAAIGTVVEAATEHERTLDDIGKSADRPSKVHNRAGEPCTGCDDTVHTVEYRRYTVYYCPTEQTGGKILADNTTSKFLK